MMVFVLLFYVSQYLERFFRSSGFYYNFLKTTLQSTVFLDILSVFVKRGSTDTLYFAASQSRLQHIGCIHRTGSCTGAYNSMNLVYEQDYVRILLQLIDNGANALFKLSAVFGSGYNRGHIEHYHPLVKQDTGYFLLNDTQCQPLYNSRLADTRLTNQHRIVFLTTTQYLRQAFYLTLTPYNRIELAFFCRTGHVRTEVIQDRSIIGRLLRGSLCRRSRSLSCIARRVGHVHVFILFFLFFRKSHTSIRVGGLHCKLFKYSLIIHLVLFQDGGSQVVAILQYSQQHMFGIGC